MSIKKKVLKREFDINLWRKGQKYWYRTIRDEIKALSYIEQESVFKKEYDRILKTIEDITIRKNTEEREKDYLEFTLAGIYSKKVLNYDMLKNIKNGK